MSVIFTVPSLSNGLNINVSPGLTVIYCPISTILFMPLPINVGIWAYGFVIIVESQLLVPSGYTTKLGSSIRIVSGIGMPGSNTTLGAPAESNVSMLRGTPSPTRFRYIEIL